MAPLITVGLPVRNAEATVEVAVRSILNQTFTDFTLLLLDDGSSDKTPEILRRMEHDDPRIRVLRGSGAGLAAALNTLLGETRTRLFARMDADDVAYPERLQLQSEMLLGQPELDLVGSSMMIINDSYEALGWRTAPSSHHEICRRPDAGFKLYHPTWMARTNWISALGYRTEAVRCEDQDLLHRSYSYSRFGNVDQVLLAYREPAVDLRAVSVGRFHFAREVTRRAGLGQPARQGAVIGEQLAKGVYEALSSKIPLPTQHRARAAPDVELTRWRSVASSLQVCADEYREPDGG